MQLYREGWGRRASVCPVLHPLTSASWGKAPGLITLQVLWILFVGLVPPK